MPIIGHRGNFWSVVAIAFLVSVLTIEGAQTYTNPTPLPMPAVPPPSTVPTPQPTPTDRQGSSNDSQTAAIVGAAVAGAMCIMLMQKAINEPDPATRDMYMLMAMIECQQAAQSRQSGDKNGDAARQLSQGETTQPQTSPTPQPQPSAIPAASNSPMPAPPDSLDVANDKTTPFENPIASPQPTPSQGALALSSAQPFAVESVSTLDPIPNSNLMVDEGASKVSSPTNGGYTAISSSAAKSMTPEELKALLEAQNKNAGKRASGDNATFIPGGNPGGASGGGSGSGSGDGKDFDAMMATLIGGGQLPEDPAGFNRDILASPKPSSQKENIFQYASFRYQRAASNENRIAKNRSRKIASQIAQ